jgi:hypothetical protein
MKKLISLCLVTAIAAFAANAQTEEPIPASPVEAVVADDMLGTLYDLNKVRTFVDATVKAQMQAHDVPLVAASAAYMTWFYYYWNLLGIQLP